MKESLTVSGTYYIGENMPNVKGNPDFVIQGNVKVGSLVQVKGALSFGKGVRVGGEAYFARELVDKELLKQVSFRSIINNNNIFHVDLIKNVN